MHDDDGTLGGGGGARSDLKPAEIMETGLSTISQA